ncbi:hydantoinase/oxoprolinase family protein [Frigidibacter albus]|uniref:Hydantoinase/oxoprolinase family protein n=1 Tax=Frigidibacter albus TaxID=1465486 RepID=A0A6L8VKJ1_9RHOB|nr:hydantoinase/oxoprolinase family protein [Frigidibacter albus]MZQ90723.1 hydantoinase/oxoprolinase family protein [Frigidibacter albus]NBE33030.1 hydantoinase/oxoprolinase family protein [Frigidibacter albus]GGH60063.1 hydantoinase [Frigidibacter albus]
MALLLGVDTGGTFTDAVLLREGEGTSPGGVLAKAKALTTRADLSHGIGAAIDAVLAGTDPAQVAMVSLSTTLATNALVEGQGGRVALVAIGFAEADLARAGLAEAMRGDPVIRIAGGHGAGGAEAAPLDLAALAQALEGLEVSAVAVAAAFATRNPAHELAAADLLRAWGWPVTCSHHLSARLNGPKRALTAVLNARLLDMIARLIDACEGHLALRGITAPLMVVRGDGALISAAQARERPIETILSGPAASIEGARWLTGMAEALVADIGGTTTDVALLRGGRPAIDPDGARVGPWRTMVEAVAMRTTGLGGDSEVHLADGLVPEGDTGLRLGPRRLIPVALLAVDHPQMVHAALDAALATEIPGAEAGRFVLPMAVAAPGLDPREAALLARLAGQAQPLARALGSRMDQAALQRLWSRGLVMIAGVTPSDAVHVLGRLAAWDTEAAEKALALMARRRSARGERIAAGAEALAARIIDQLTAQTVGCLLEAALAEDGFTAAPADPLLRAALSGHSGTLRLQAALGVPLIGLGASAASYYGAVGQRLHTKVILPADGDVANAIGAVVGRVSMHAEALVSSPGPGRFVAHLPDGPAAYPDPETALKALAPALEANARAAAASAGLPDPQITRDEQRREAQIEGQTVFIESRLRITASGRPRQTRD